MLRVSYAYVKSGTHYLRPTPPCFQQGPLRMFRPLNADHTQRMGVFLPVLRTPFNVVYMPHSCEHMQPIAVHKT